MNAVQSDKNPQRDAVPSTPAEFESIKLLALRGDSEYCGDWSAVRIPPKRWTTRNRNRLAAAGFKFKNRKADNIVDSQFYEKNILGQDGFETLDLLFRVTDAEFLGLNEHMRKRKAFARKKRLKRRRGRKGKGSRKGCPSKSRQLAAKRN